MTGKVSYHAGLAAEDAVCALYERAGLTVAARRWRGMRGEIDLALRDGPSLIFVEVKKSRDFARAAASLGSAQVRRLYDTAAEFMATEPGGLNTDARFDVALVNAAGEISILENALCAA
ncbi:YraN family protein [Roseicitreum antarcticum]|uniref:UPF0102 protein SAMN04488238_101617 n=1 Tax=Roseicitreum antarcticum TaxID=564137 RepID=A0A1H2SIR1_9RHOB|nr:YraN family protein [Roseicitreum antarcticum]SDW31480.1 putative endonuclease [Roseicitreum antarcticum]